VLPIDLVQEAEFAFEDELRKRKLPVIKVSEMMPALKTWHPAYFA
jgi:hypothetical protein